MNYAISSTGWFTSINGRTVVRLDLSSLGHTSFALGAPNGLLWHYTASCNDDTSGGIKAKGYLTHAFAVGRDGTIRQYAPLFTAAWHAFDVSKWKIGVEHTALPGSCNLTDEQLQASAELFAAIISEIKIQKGIDVPVVHVPGCDYTTPGIKEHKDGVGCPWDPNTHTDGLYGWGWPRYLAAITTAIEDKEDAMFKEFEQGSRDRQDGKALPQGASDAYRFGWYMETRIIRAAKSPTPTTPTEVPEHKHVAGGVDRV